MMGNELGVDIPLLTTFMFLFPLISEPSARRQGLAHESLILMMYYGKCYAGCPYVMLCVIAVAELGVLKFRAKILDSNVASLQLFQKKLDFVEVVFLGHPHM